MKNMSFGIVSLFAVFTALTVSLPAYKAQAGATSSTSAVLSIQKELDPIANPQDGRTKTKGWIIGRVTDAATDAPLARAQIEVHARIVDQLSDGTLSLRSMEETIPLGIVSYTNSKGKFKVKVPLDENTKYFKVIARIEGYQKLQNVMVKVEPLKRSVVNFQLIKNELPPQETEILEKKHELQKKNLFEKNPSFIQTIDTTKDTGNEYTPPYPIDMKELFLYQQAYTVPDQVYVVNLNGFTGYLNFDDLISGVVSAELGGSFPFETLKAQAVASRSYALEQYNRTGVANGGQAYTSTINDTCRTATANTSKIVTLYGGNVISAYFAARCNGDSTLNSEDGVWHKTGACSVGGNYIAYARSMLCSGHDNCSLTTEAPCCNVTTGGRNVYIYGHGVGMCQRGAQQFACRDGKDWQQILTGYYTGITIANLPALDVGNRIVTTSDVNARLTPCSSNLLLVPSGTYGMIKAGPNISFCSNLGTCNGGSGTYWTWWQVDYDNGVIGRWSVENYLKKMAGSSQPDMVVTSLTVPTNGTVGGQITVSSVIANQGTGNAGSFEVGYYLSTDSIITTSDTLLSPQCNIAGLSAGTSSSACEGAVTIPLSLASGTYYFGAIVDYLGEVTEIDESNNNKLADTGPITITPPHTVTATINSISPNPATQGTTVNFSGTGSDLSGHSITAYSWRSSIDEVIGTSANFGKSDLSVGSHNIYLKVQCSNGTWSSETSWLGNPLVINPPDPCITTVFSDRWMGEYYNNKDLSGSPSMVRDDGNGFIDFDWGSDCPGSSCSIGNDNFSVRWTRTVDFNTDDTYRFAVTSDDGFRLYVDDLLKLDYWIDQAPTTYTVDVPLLAGNHTIKMDYYDASGCAIAKLLWQPVVTQCTDAYEPNDDFSLAYGTLTSGGNYHGKICGATDEDFFKITVDSPGMISLTLIVPSNKDYDAHLYDTSQVKVAGSELRGEQVENINYSATTVGTYYIHIFGYAGAYDESQTYTLSGSWPTNPINISVTSFKVNDDAVSTTSRTVTLNNTVTGCPTDCMASESSTFNDASWQAYATAPAFTLSTGDGAKTVYFKVRNANDESAVVSDVIQYEPCAYHFSSTSQTFDFNSGSSSVGVTASSGSCSWTAASNADWITITSGISGAGNGTVYYSVSANTGANVRTGTMTIAGQTFTVTQSGSGNLVTNDLWIRAVINTEEKGPVDAVWQKGGESTTARGDRAIWGHFYASPLDVSWGSQNNPDLYVKIWFDVSGRIDVNYFHVSVPDIAVYTEYPYNGSVDLQGTTTTSRRYIRHYFQGGVAFSEENYEDGVGATGYNPNGNPAGDMTINNLRIGSLINTVEKGLTNGVWRLGGQDTTDRGDQVVWGFLYASPSDVSWGNQDNPDLYVKIWFDVSGRIDVNYFHVSVPDIEVYSDYPSDGVYNQKGTTIMADRYIRHVFWK